MSKYVSVFFRSERKSPGPGYSYSMQAVVFYPNNKKISKQFAFDPENKASQEKAYRAACAWARKKAKELKFEYRPVPLKELQKKIEHKFAKELFILTGEEAVTKIVKNIKKKAKTSKKTQIHKNKPTINKLLDCFTDTVDFDEMVRDGYNKIGFEGMRDFADNIMLVINRLRDKEQEKAALEEQVEVAIAKSLADIAKQQNVDLSGRCTTESIKKHYDQLMGGYS